MSVFSVPVTIGVCEEEIAKRIEQNVEQQVVNVIKNEVEEIIFDKRYYSDRTEPLKRLIRDEIKKVLTDKEDLIIQEAAKTLAEKMIRTKAVRDVAADVAKKTLK